MHAGNSPASAWPRTSEAAPRWRLDVRVDAAALRATMAADVRRGLTATPKALPPKYFYDAAGSALFERITRLPEYYPTRVERSILGIAAPRVMRELDPDDVVELGAGGPAKILALLGASVRRRLRYIPVDVDGETMAAAARALTLTQPGVEVHGLVGDFERHLAYVPPPAGRRLVAFFGSTIGNLAPRPRRGLLRQVRRLLRGGDHFLLGVDLVKEARVLEAAYDDAAGVTAAFNRNVLSVINRELDGDFDPAAFDHRARWDAGAARVEMHLVARAPVVARLRALDVVVRLARGETIWTESSYKFTQHSVSGMLAAAGLAVAEWWTDPARRFALVLARPEP